MRFLQAQIDIDMMVYNILRFPSNPPQNRQVLLKEILEDYTPDVLMVNELDDAAGSNLLLTQSLQPINSSYSQATFVFNQSTNDPLNNMLYYNSDKLTLVAQTLYTTTLRDISHYTLRLNTVDVDTDPINIHCFVTHLKASTGTVNQQIRLAMVNVFLAALQDIPANDYVIFAGDFNFYTSNEPGYQALLSTNNTHLLVDPINAPGSWHNSATLTYTHTQSTRTSSSVSGQGLGTGYATGGLDDRFDFILIKNTMMNDPKLQYVPNSYKAIGNNGNCLDLNINNPACSGTYPLSLRQKLHDMSDHLPVFLKLNSNKTLSNQQFTKTRDWLKVAPNPVVNYLSIHLDDNTSVDEIEIYNNLGQLIDKHELRSSTNLTIDVSHYQHGFYWVKDVTQSNVAIPFIKK